MRVSGSTSDVSSDEIMALIARSSLATIIVEGRDDIIVYRNLEEKLSYLGVSVLPVGGRSRVLEIYERSKHLSNAKLILCIADRDVWIHTNIPAELIDDRLLFTNGYSIENDVYMGGKLWQLMSENEKNRFNSDLERFIHWYSLALARALSGDEEEIARHPDHVLNLTLYAGLIALRDGESHPTNLKDDLISNYSVKLRGKSLMPLLIRHISYKGREARHNSKALMELVSKQPAGILADLFDKVEDFFTKVT